MVRDFSRHALNLYSKPSSSEVQMEACQKMIRKPVSRRTRATSASGKRFTTFATNTK